MVTTISSVWTSRVNNLSKVHFAINDEVERVKNLNIVKTMVLEFIAIKFFSTIHSVLGTTALMSIEQRKLLTLLTGAEIEFEMVPNENGTYTNPVLLKVKLSKEMKDSLEYEMTLAESDNSARKALITKRIEQTVDKLFAEEAEAPAKAADEEAPATEEAPVVELTRWQKAALTRARNRAAAAAASSE